MTGEKRPLDTNGTIYIGQEQDSFAGGLDRLQSTSAFMAQVSEGEQTRGRGRVKGREEEE